jgi:cysteine synthase
MVRQTGGEMITRLLSLEALGLPNSYAKMESENITGSMKIRSAKRILDSARLVPGQTVIESTSGNMGVALATLCKARGLSCVLVVDPKLSPWHRDRMLEADADLIEVTETDNTGGWLKRRLAKVNELYEEHEDWFWVNQYGNKNNPLAFEEIAYELYTQLHLEAVSHKNIFLFASVSTGGSLTGTARRLKRLTEVEGHSIHVVAVDAAGSAIFGESPCKRHLNGIGSSLSELPNLDRSLIDCVSIVTDEEAFRECHNLRSKGFFVGGSSGAVLSAMKRFARMDENFLTNVIAVGIFPDSGLIYEQTIYSERWLSERGFAVWEIQEPMKCGG